jgi:hypothetical protein
MSILQNWTNENCSGIWHLQPTKSLQKVKLNKRTLYFIPKLPAKKIQNA